VFFAPLAVAAILGSTGWIAFVLAVRLCGAAPASRRWAAAAIMAYWIASSLFLALAAFHAFRVAVVIVLLGTTAAVVHVRVGRPADAARVFRRDLRRLRKVTTRLFRGWHMLIAVPMCGIVAVVALRGLAFPPLAWDSLTYHLVRAGRWVQAGGWWPLHAPDAWGYYEYYPPGGDLIWAWAMLPGRGDTFVAPAGLIVWLSAGLGAFAAGRALGARRSNALAAAAVAATVPAVFNYVNSAYVDTTTIALVLLAIPFLQQCTRPRPGPAPVLAMASLALASGVKIVALPMLVLSAAWILIALIIRTGGARAALVYVAVGVAAAAPGLYGYARAWIERGSAFYPFGLTIGGVELFAGNPERILLHSGQLFDAPVFCAWDFLTDMFVARIHLGITHTGLGPLSVLIAALGLVAAGRLTIVQRQALLVGLLLAWVASVLWGTFSPGELAARTFWALPSARFLALPLALLAVLASVLRALWVRCVWWVLLGVHLLMMVPLSWSGAQAAAFGETLVIALAALGGSVLAWRAVRCRGGVAPAAALVAAVLCLCAAALERTRGSFRYRIYADATDGTAWDVDRLEPDYAAAWPIWQRFDQPRGHRLAVAAGWDGIGHNWYLYPLMGRRVQNVLIYETPIQDGSILDYRNMEEIVARADAAAWLERLLASRVGFLVTLAPDTLEWAWAIQLPAIFPPDVEGAHPFHRTYRFDPEAARRTLERTARHAGSSPDSSGGPE